MVLVIGNMIKQTTKPAGRPAIYDTALAHKVIAKLGEGKSLVKSCKEIGGVSPRTVYGWMSSNPIFLQDYTRAKEEAADVLAEQIVDLADTELPVDEFGRIDSGRVQQLRLQVEARKWIAAKLKPKRYGDRIIQEHSGPGGQPLMVITGVPALTSVQPVAHVEHSPSPMLIDVEATVREDGDDDGDEDSPLGL